MSRSIRCVLVLAVCGGAHPVLAQSDPAQEAPPKQERLRFRARHILIAWKSFAGAEAVATKEQARKTADEILRKLRAGADFTTLAKQYSACPSRLAGGDLGQFPIGRMQPEFEQAVRACKIGEYAGPVETQLGFHLIQRLEVRRPWPDLVTASHILIQYEGAERAREDVERRRDKEEARALATRLLAEIRSGRLDFAEAARKHSDDASSAARGGHLGTMSPEDFLPAFSDALCGLEEQGIAGPVETPLGFHLIRREKLEQPLRASHILIPWRGAARAPDDVLHTKEQALDLAKKLLARIRAGEPFDRLARENSTCHSRLNGGDLGLFHRGQMVKAFEEAVRQATVGEVVGPVETPFGYHLILRTR